MERNETELGRILKQQRVAIPLTLQELASASGVSSSHLGRIERGERFPSAHILRRIAKPLGFDLNELLIMAGHLSPEPSNLPEEQRDKLRAELNALLDRVATDSRRIKEIVDRLQMTR